MYNIRKYCLPVYINSPKAESFAANYVKLTVTAPNAVCENIAQRLFVASYVLVSGCYVT